MRDMAEKKTLSGNVLDSWFGMFRECLRYKLARQGKSLILVDRYFPSTRVCSVCGQVRASSPHRKETWICPKCGARHNREVNAAKNIKTQGLAQYFEASDMQERRESA